MEFGSEKFFDVGKAKQKPTRSALSTLFSLCLRAVAYP
jgi:hypothetical protein